MKRGSLNGCVVKHGSPWGCFVLLLTWSGCATDNSARNAPNASSRTRSTPALAASFSEKDGAGSVSRLSVNAESIEAAEIWAGRHDELTAKARSLPDSEYRSFVAERAATLITDQIAEMLLYQQASLRNPTEDSDALERFVDEQIRKTVTADFEGVQRRYEKHLESQGQTLEKVRTKIRRELIISRYFETEIKPKIAEPTRADLLAAFREIGDSWRRPPRRSMSLIDVRVLDRLPKEMTQPSREELAAARREALLRIESAQRELQGGTPFKEVARKYSDGLAASEGGSWGWVSKEGVRKRFELAVEVLDSLAAGQVSNIVETDDGFFLVRCDELDPGVEPDFQSIQPELRERFQRGVYNRMVGERVRELRAKAKVEPADLSLFHAAVVAASLKLRSNSE